MHLPRLVGIMVDQYSLQPGIALDRPRLSENNGLAGGLMQQQTSTTRICLSLGLVTLAYLTLTSCSARSVDDADRQAEHKPLNVIMILVDTLRADHVGSYGYQRQTTPFLDEYAHEGVLFMRARSQAACTYPSVNSMLTSRYPYDFYSSEDDYMGIPEEYPSLAEMLTAEGYQTLAVSASPIVRASPSSRNPDGGFGRGFDKFDESCAWQDAACVNRAAGELLSQAKEPFFLYLHYMDPHAFYQPPSSYQRRFAGDYDGHEFIAEGDTSPIAKMLYSNGEQINFSDQDRQHLVDLYDDEIHYLDSQLRQLHRYLRSRGLLDRSLLLITADHGEEFLEHNHVGHCRGLWSTVTHVPLLMRWPGGPADRRIEAAVEYVDLVPTVIDLLGISPADAAFEGSSLLPLIEDESPAQISYAFSDQGRYRAADDGRYQLIMNGNDQSVQLFDLENDPLALNDLSTQDEANVERLGAELNLWLHSSGQWLVFEEALEAAKQKHEMLRALGYLE
jgi:arylsulfatase